MTSGEEEKIWDIKSYGHAQASVAKPGGFCSFYSRFTPKKYVTAVFFCGQTLALPPLLGQTASLSARGGVRRAMQSDAVSQRRVRCVAAPSARCWQCSSCACSDWGHSLLCVADWCFGSSIAQWWRRSECRLRGSGCTLRARRRHIQSP